jgi:hypothetical protein
MIVPIHQWPSLFAYFKDTQEFQILGPDETVLCTLNARDALTFADVVGNVLTGEEFLVRRAIPNEELTKLSELFPLPVVRFSHKKE